MISIEAREKMLEHLQSSYGEAFAAGYVHIRESDAAPGKMFTTMAWPQANPEIRFQVFYNAGVGTFTEYYERACIAHRARPQILGAFERETGMRIGDVGTLLLSMPAEYEVEPDLTLESLVRRYPDEVSLTLTLFVATEPAEFDAAQCVDAMQRFVQRYVEPAGFGYLTLRVYFMEAQRIAAYREMVMEPVPDQPPAADIIADFWLVRRVGQIGRGDLEAALRVGGETQWR